MDERTRRWHVSCRAPDLVGGVIELSWHADHSVVSVANSDFKSVWASKLFNSAIWPGCSDNLNEKGVVSVEIYVFGLYHEDTSSIIDWFVKTRMGSNCAVLGCHESLEYRASSILRSCVSRQGEESDRDLTVLGDLCRREARLKRLCHSIVVVAGDNNRSFWAEV